MHWSARYIGKPYVEGEYDCVALVTEIRRNEFNQDISVGIKRERSIIKQSEQIAAHLSDYVYPISRADAEEGDIVLLKAKGRLNHVGMVCEIDKVIHVLHNVRKKDVMSVVLHRLRELDKYGLATEGFYRFHDATNVPQTSATSSC